jgi:hypothetical protein
MSNPYFNLFITVITGNANKEQLEECEVLISNARNKQLFTSLKEVYQQKLNVEEPIFNSITAWQSLKSKLKIS